MIGKRATRAHGVRHSLTYSDCATGSRTVGIPSGRFLPSPLSMYFRRTGVVPVGVVTYVVDCECGSSFRWFFPPRPSPLPWKSCHPECNVALKELERRGDPVRRVAG